MFYSRHEEDQHWLQLPARLSDLSNLSDLSDTNLAMIIRNCSNDRQK